MLTNEPDYTIAEIINKILISRGAPKKKYSQKGPKLRMAGPEDLSSEQLNCINDGLKEGKLYLFLVDQHSDPPKNSATLSS